MASTVSQVRTAIATAVATVSGLRASPILTDQINPPEAVVSRKTWTYDEVQHGDGAYAVSTVNFTVRVFGSRTSERVNEALFDSYAEPTGATSIKSAVETNAALAGVCDWVLVTEVGEILIVTVGAIDYFAVDFNVQVGLSA